MTRRFILLHIILFAVIWPLRAQILEDYVQQGLANNMTLQQKQLSYQKSVEALKEAKGLFLPEISLNARYSVAQGGRVIDLPIGDMLNPVYSTLNQLTQAYPDPFPLTTLDNQEIQFLRPTEQETKLRLIQPIFNPQIYLNKNIKNEMVKLSLADENTYKRELVFEIKSAYFSYLKTLNLMQLLDYTSTLVEENIRVNQKLFENDKITKDILLRSEAEKSNVEYQKALVNKDRKIAQSYFNFLLNQNSSTDILVDTSLYIRQQYSLDDSKNQALQNREELSGMEIYKQVAGFNVKINKANKIPTIVSVVDYGYQGEKHNFSSNNDYFMASVVLKWDLFKGFQNNSKVQQARIDQEIIQSKSDELQRIIQIQVENAYNELEASYILIDAAEKELSAMQEAFRVIQKKYMNQQASLLELIDARKTMTMANEKFIIAKYDAMIKLAEFEKTVCLYNLN